MADQEIREVESVTIAVPQETILPYIERGPRVSLVAQTFVVDDQESYDAALVFIQQCRANSAEVVEFLREIKQRAYNTHRAVSSLENALVAPFEAAVKTVSKKRITWDDEQERQRRETERLQQEALKKEQTEQAFKEAEQLAAMGHTEAAEEIVDRAIAAPPPQHIAPSTINKEANKGAVRQLGKWEIRIDNPDKVQRPYCSPDDSKIRKIVDALGQGHGIDGITIEWKKSESFTKKGKA